MLKSNFDTKVNFLVKWNAHVLIIENEIFIPCYLHSVFDL